MASASQGKWDALKDKVAAYTLGVADRVAIIIKTINRKNLLFSSLDSIFTHADVPFRLYIGDDGTIDPEQKDVYELLQRCGHFVRIYDQPIALTAGLNDLFRATAGEEFILRMDDDFGFCADTRVSVMRRILEMVPSLGGIGGAERDINLAKGKRKVSLRQGFLIRRGTTLYRVSVAPSDIHCTTIGGHRFAAVGYTTNFLLIRRRVLESVAWNEDLWARGEHLDFSLRLAQAGWLIGFTPNSWHEHRDDRVPTAKYTERDIKQNNKEGILSREYGIRSVQRFNLARALEKVQPRRPAWYRILKCKLGRPLGRWQALSRLFRPVKRRRPWLTR